MQFSRVLIAAAALVGGANAVLNITNTVFNGIVVGKPFTITWGDAVGPVTLTLQNGDPLNLKTYEVLVSGGSFPSGSFTWTPPADLPTDNYNVKVEDGTSAPNYSAQFEFFGASTSTSATGSSTTSAPSSTSIDSTTPGPTSTATSSTNSTTTTGSSSRTSSTRTSTSATTSPSSTSAPGSINSGSNLASPVAMVVLGFAALLAFN